jgi:AcrR family transcriptional regulator
MYYMRRKKTPARAADSYHHGDLRQALIDACFAEVDRSGPDAISLAAIARTVGVSQAAPYRHFPDRDALLAAITAEGFRLFIAALTEASAAGPKRSALLRMGRAYVAFGTSRPGLYRLMFASPLLAQAAASDELGVVAQDSFRLLVDAVDRSLAPRDRERRAVKIWVGLHGAVMLANQNLLQCQPASDAMHELVKDILT